MTREPIRVLRVIARLNVGGPVLRSVQAERLEQVLLDVTRS